MKIIYPHPMIFPNTMAHSIQVTNTCWEIASQGVEVNLIVRKIEKSSIMECLKVYGLCEQNNLSISGPKDKSRKIVYYYNVLREILHNRNDKETIVFLRDKKLTRLLLFFKWFFKLPCIFESHAVTYLVHQNKYIREKTETNIANWFRSKLKVWKTFRLERYIYQNADGIICTTPGAKKVIYEKFNISAPVKIIYNATRIAAANYKHNRKDILYLGQLYPQKGTDILIQSLQYLPGQKLIIIGGNKKKDILRTQKLCNRIGVKDRVVITGYVEPRELEHYFGQIGVGVIPILDVLETRLFTSPLKLFDYMAAKIPIVASDLPSIREVLTDGETGILVEPNNPKKLAEGVEKILSEPALAKKISEQAYQKAMNYTWQKRSEKIITFITKIQNQQDIIKSQQLF
jgi:glycosyltransferase involved in cell wall biosynthesis